MQLPQLQQSVSPSTTTESSLNTYSPHSSCCWRSHMSSTKQRQLNVGCDCTAQHMSEIWQVQERCQRKGHQECKREADSRSTSAVNTSRKHSNSSSLAQHRKQTIAITIVVMAFRNYISMVRDKLSAKRRRDKAAAQAATAVAASTAAYQHNVLYAIRGSLRPADTMSSTEPDS